MTKYNEKQAAKDTKVSQKYVKAAWHNARNDAAGTRLQGRPKAKGAVKYDPKKHGPH